MRFFQILIVFLTLFSFSNGVPPPTQPKGVSSFFFSPKESCCEVDAASRKWRWLEDDFIASSGACPGDDGARGDARRVRRRRVNAAGRRGERSRNGRIRDQPSRWETETGRHAVLSATQRRRKRSILNVHRVLQERIDSNGWQRRSIRALRNKFLSQTSVWTVHPKRQRRRILKISAQLVN